MTYAKPNKEVGPMTNNQLDAFLEALIILVEVTDDAGKIKSALARIQDTLKKNPA